MRRWSELAERVAATTRTSEKTALLADYLRSLTPDELPIAAVFLTGRPFPEADQRTTGLGWSAIVDRRRRPSPAATASDLGAAYDRHSDLSLAVEDVLTRRRPRAAARGDARRSPRWPPRSRRSSTPPAPAAKAAPPARPARARRPATAKAIVKVLGGELRIGLREGLVEAAIAKAFDRPLDDVKWAGMLTGDIGRLADARPRRPRSTTPSWRSSTRSSSCSPRRPRTPTRSSRRLGAGGLGRGQVRRHPGPAPQARRGRPALLARPPRRQQPVPRGRRGRAAAAPGTASSTARSWPSRTASCCRSSASRRGSGASAVRRDPGRHPGHLRRLRPARARRRGDDPTATRPSSRCCASRCASAARGSTRIDLPLVDDGGRFARSHLAVAARRGRARGGLRRRPRPAQRGPDGQGPRRAATRPAGAASAG